MPERHVLIVDDCELIRQVLTDAFTPAGYRVRTAADGEEALRLMAGERPDLVVADILMPVMDGWALCQRLRSDPALQDIPIIFLTTERDVPKRIKALEMGADDYLCKPFSKEELLARAAAVLRRMAPRRGDHEEVPAPPPPPMLTGHTDHLAMTDLLQLLSQNGRSGTLHLSGASVARVYFREGKIVNAETQGLAGEKALFRIMAWPAARFEFEPGEPARRVEEALTAGTSTMLMEGFAHLDELRELVEGLPEHGTILRVSPGRAQTIDGMALSTTQRLILLTAGPRGKRIDQIVDMVPDKDLDAYAALRGLLDEGLLEVVDGSRVQGV